MILVAHEVGTLGGMEAQLGILARGLLAADIPVTVIARECALEPHRLLSVHRIRTPRRPFPLGYPLFAVIGTLALWRRKSGIVHATGAIVFSKVDCVTVHFCHAAYDQLQLGSRAASPGVVRRVSASLSHNMARAAEKWCYRRSRTRSVIAVSAGVEAEVCEHFPELGDRLHVIGHGVDSERFRPNAAARVEIRQRLGLAAGDLVAVFVGGDWKRKGLRHAIAAVAKTDRWNLVVVGRGDAEPYSRNARELGVGDRVQFVGVSDEVEHYLAAGDVFLLPTTYETFCLVAFEAAAAGLPLLVSRVSGPDVLVQAGINGYFLDQDAQRTASLLDGYSAPRMRTRHGEAALARSRSFSWSAAVAMHIELYERLALEGRLDPPASAPTSASSSPTAGPQKAQR